LIPNVLKYLRENGIVPKPLCTGLYTVEEKIAYNNRMYAFSCGKCSDVHLIAS
jgi:hypothetical protein